MVIGLCWFMGCWTMIIGIPMIIISIFELILFSKSASMPSDEFKQQARIIAIIELIEFFCLNIIAGICGIIVFVNLKEAK